MIAPYVVAGRATGGAMRWSGEALGVEGRTAELFKDEKIAQIAGAGIYDGMRRPDQGQTRLGNALSGLVSPCSSMAMLSAKLTSTSLRI
jgi:hypothetical protein